MPISEAKFGIKITTEADTSGAAAAAKSLEEVGEQAEHSAHNSRLLTESLRSISPELGELGKMLHASEFGVGFAGTMALGFAFEKLSEHLETVREKMSKAIETAIELKHRFEDAMVKATIEATAAQEKFAAALDEVGRKQDRATEAMNRIISVTAETTKQTETLIDAQLKLYEAQLQQAVGRGEVTPAAASEEQRAAEKQARAQKDAAEDADEQAKIDARIARGQIASGEISADKSALNPLYDKSKRESASIGAQEGEIKSRELELQAAIQAVKDAKTWALSPGGVAAAGVHAVMGDKTWGVRESKERQQDAAARLKTAEDDLKTATEHAGVLKNEHDATLRKISLLETEITARTELAQKLAEEATEIGEDLKRRQAARAQIEATNARAQAVADATAREARINSGKASADDLSIEEGYNAGRANPRAAVSSIAYRFEQARRNAAAKVPGSQEELRSMLEHLMGIIEATHEQGQSGLADLKSQIYSLENRLRGQINNTGFGY
jgi:hypothetical protein